MNIKNILSLQNLKQLSLLSRYVIGAILFAVVYTILWNNVYHFDPTPLLAIDGIFIFNLIIGILAKRVSLAMPLLIAINYTLIFLGFILLRGLLAMR